MNILYCKDLWWPFGSHLMHIMYRKMYCDMHGYKLLYLHNKHPAYSLYEGKISELFSSISDIDDKDIIEFANKNYSDADHYKHFLLKFSDKKEFESSFSISYNDDIGQTWYEFKPSKYVSIKEYQADVMKKIAEPSDNIKQYLQTVPFIQEVCKLNGDYIAIHIRWTDKVNGWCTEADFYDVDVYFKYALELREKHGTNNIVLNCDNIDALTKVLNYNTDNKLNFNILWDEKENLPPNNSEECIFQKWCFEKVSSPDVLVNDLLNGFKIYKTIFEADSVISNHFSNMALAPCIARNCSKDINISQNIPYGLLPKGLWSFSETVIKKRIEGRKLKTM